MNKTIALIISVLCIMSSAAVAQAKPGDRPASSSRSSSTSYESSGSPKKFGFGYASATNITGSSSALTGLIGLNETDAIQVYFAIPSTSPFTVFAGGAYKHTVAGNQNDGFHLGGAVGLGVIGSNSITVTAAGTTTTTSDFGFSFTGLAGFHFTAFSNILVAIDGGPTLQVIDGNADFAVSSLSSLLGLSVIYIF